MPFSCRVCIFFQEKYRTGSSSKTPTTSQFPSKTNPTVGIQKLLKLHQKLEISCIG